MIRGKKINDLCKSPLTCFDSLSLLDGAGPSNRRYGPRWWQWTPFGYGYSHGPGWRHPRRKPEIHAVQVRSFRAGESHRLCGRPVQVVHLESFYFRHKIHPRTKHNSQHSSSSTDCCIDCSNIETVCVSLCSRWYFSYSNNSFDRFHIRHSKALDHHSYNRKTIKF